jgi:hypothetical protein
MTEEKRRPWQGISAEEIAFMRMTQDQRSPGEKLDAYLKQKELDRLMRDVVHDNRGMSVHDRGRATLPRPEAELLPKGSGWKNAVPLEQRHVAACDRLLDAQDARDLRARLREERET